MASVCHNVIPIGISFLFGKRPNEEGAGVQGRNWTSPWTFRGLCETSCMQGVAIDSLLVKLVKSLCPKQISGSGEAEGIRLENGLVTGFSGSGPS